MVLGYLPMAEDYLVIHLSETGSSNTRQVAFKILAYLERHPDAMDSEKGIAQWWVHEDLKQVKAALALLMKRKILQVRALNGQRYYLLREQSQGRSLLIEQLWMGQGKAGLPRNRRSKRP